MKGKADYVLDFRGTIIPFALLRMNQILREMKTDEVLEIITKDPDVRSDVLKVIPGASCELIDMQLNKETDYCLIRLKKKRHFRP